MLLLFDKSMSPTERTPIVIQPCLRSRVGLWEKYYYTPFDITPYFPSDVGFTKNSIVVQCTRQVGVEWCHTVGDNIFGKYDAYTCMGSCKWHSAQLTLKVLNFWTFIETWSGWIFDSYWSLKPLCSGMGEVVPARTSPTLPPPSPRTVLWLSCFKVSQCINCRD